MIICDGNKIHDLDYAVIRHWIHLNWSFDAVTQRFLHFYVEWRYDAMQRCYVTSLNRKSSMHGGVRLIESIITLRKGQGNPIRVSMICNPRRGLPSRGCHKSFTRGWDSLVPSGVKWLIIFLARLFLKYIIRFQCRFSCSKHNVMTPLPMHRCCLAPAHEDKENLSRGHGEDRESWTRGMTC